MIQLLLAVIYISFITLGLPGSLLGSAWPTIYPEFNVPVSYMGIISMIISIGTIISSLLNNRLTHKFGTGKVTAFSVAVTAVSLLGFSFSNSFWMMCLWALPYGLGTGSADVALNNYVSLHYSSRHMSWLHCVWGVGASMGAYIMGYALTGGQHWGLTYRLFAILQIALTAVLFLCIPRWKGTTKNEISKNAVKEDKPLSLLQIVKIPGAKEVMVTCFCYCALEQTTNLWASSYLVLYKGIDSELAATFASLFFIGLTGGRALNGFLTMKLTNTQLVRAGQCVIALGVVAMLLPVGDMVSLIGLVLIGLGCAPIYPNILHSTPAHFGADKSQAIVGVQMASAYVGTGLMPPLFGLIANHISASLLPVYLSAILVLMIVMHERLVRKGNIGGI